MAEIGSGGLPGRVISDHPDIKYHPNGKVSILDAMPGDEVRTFASAKEIIAFRDQGGGIMLPAILNMASESGLGGSAEEAGQPDAGNTLGRYTLGVRLPSHQGPGSTELG